MFILLLKSYIINYDENHKWKEVTKVYFADYMKKLRSEKSLTQAEMGEILGVSAQSIKMIENGSTNFPSKKVLYKIADYVHQFPVAVAAEIIYGDENYESDEFGYLSCRYLSYKYINGWNLDEVPVELKHGTKTTLFSGKISKRRDPKNSSIVIEFKEFLLPPQRDITLDEAYDILATIVTIVVQNKEPFRRVEVLFDINEYYESAAYQRLEDIEIYKLPIDLEIILFSPDTGEICHKVNLRK